MADPGEIRARAAMFEKWADDAKDPCTRAHYREMAVHYRTLAVEHEVRPKEESNQIVGF
jgi:hypothetical protein